MNKVAYGDKVDMINHPKHYCREDAIECLDEMRLVFGDDIVAAFCLCNVWKYRYRAASKGQEEDLKKSDFYMRKYEELINKGLLQGDKSLQELKEAVHFDLCGQGREYKVRHSKNLKRSTRNMGYLECGQMDLRILQKKNMKNM